MQTQPIHRACLGHQGPWGPIPQAVRDTGDAEWERRSGLPPQNREQSQKGPSCHHIQLPSSPSPPAALITSVSSLAHKQVTGLPLSPHHPRPRLPSPSGSLPLSIPLPPPERQVGPRRRKEFRKKGGVLSFREVLCLTLLPEP